MRNSQKKRLKILLISFFLIFTIGFLFYKDMRMPKIPKKFEKIELPKEILEEKKEIQIGVISDTHIPTRAESLHNEVKNKFQGVDLILHSGDLVSLEVLEKLQKIAPTIAVEGNMDFPEVKEKLPEAIELQIFNFKIAILHSPIPTWTLSHFNWLQEKFVKRLIKEKDFDILIFGHTHRSFVKELEVGGKKFLLLNPGSPTDPFFSSPSVGILKITKDTFKGEIIHLK